MKTSICIALLFLLILLNDTRSQSSSVKIPTLKEKCEKVGWQLLNDSERDSVERFIVSISKKIDKVGWEMLRNGEKEFLLVVRRVVPDTAAIYDGLKLLYQVTYDSVHRK